MADGGFAAPGIAHEEHGLPLLDAFVGEGEHAFETVVDVDGAVVVDEGKVLGGVLVVVFVDGEGGLAVFFDDFFHVVSFFLGTQSFSK